MYFVYILSCSNGSLYTGITTDLEKRFKEHKAGRGGHYTSANQPTRIRYFEACPNRSAASTREAQIKKLSRAQKLVLIKK